MKRNDLIKTQCWSCWWREGGDCFSEDFGKLQKKGIFFVGREITYSHIEHCQNSKIEKRAMLQFPKDKLIILSENAK